MAFLRANTFYKFVKQFSFIEVRRIVGGSPARQKSGKNTGYSIR